MRGFPRDPLIWQTSVLKFHDRSLADVKAHLEQYYGAPVAIDQPHWDSRPDIQDSDKPQDLEVHKEIRLVLYLHYEMAENRLSIFCRNLSLQN